MTRTAAIRSALLLSLACASPDEPTAETPLHAREEAPFPAQRPNPGLISEPHALPRGWPPRGNFTVDHLGDPHLYFTEEQRIVVYGDDEELASTIEVDVNCWELLALSRRTEIACILTLASDHHRRDRQFVCAFDARWKPKWTYRPDLPGVKDMALLQTENGVEGVVVATVSALVALDHDGGVRWSLTNPTPPYCLLSHAELPGVLFSVYPGIQRFEVSANSATLRERRVREEDNFETWAGELFPDADGRPSLIVAGPGKDRAATLARLDENGTELWTATLPGRLGWMQMLEAPGKPRLFVATVNAGQLYVFDEDGTLLHQASFPEEDESGRRITYSLAAGELYAGEWAIYLRTMAGGYLYSVNLAAL